MAQIAVLGHGVVGSGVVELLEKNAEGIARRAGEVIEVKRILDLREFPELHYADKFTKSFDEIEADPEISVVVEVMGGVHPAYDYAVRALNSGKSVVTSNKELVAKKGAELLKTAKENGQNFLFEASVGGGIPIIRPLHQCLAANEIDEIAGILNGTTNFILTKMRADNMSFADALALAQKLGYAEANPAADVEGHDTCRKICILASLAFGSHVYPDNVYTQGINELDLSDLYYAEDGGYAVKLIGQARREDDKVFAMVSPALIPSESQLASIGDVYNGILVRGNATGDVVFYGRGAGKLPTASAVVSDVIDCIHADDTIMSLQWADSSENNVLPHDSAEFAYYIRCKGSLADVGSVFGTFDQLSRQNRPDDEIAFTISAISGSSLNDLFARAKSKGIEVLSSIRILNY